MDKLRLFKVNAQSFSKRTHFEYYTYESLGLFLVILLHLIQEIVVEGMFCQTYMRL